MRGVRLAAAALVVAAAGCATTPTVTGGASGPTAPSAKHKTRPPSPKAPHRPSRRAGAAAALVRLPVKGRAPMTGYGRDEFGQAWLDTDRNGCDTRDDILARDLTHREYEPGTYGCVVVSGELDDPYTGTLIHFVKGDGDLVDIDHVVALGDAWVTGAYKWPIRKRAALANDPLNLLPVDASANRQKGDADAATWLPANKPYRCSYVARQVAVKAKYGLWVTAAEKSAIARVLSACPKQPTPPDSGAPVLAPVNVTEPSRGQVSSTPSATPRSGNDGSARDRRFDTCTDAKAHGYGPYTQGQDPEYAWYEDRDGDGVVCE